MTERINKIQVIQECTEWFNPPRHCLIPIASSAYLEPLDQHIPWDTFNRAQCSVNPLYENKKTGVRVVVITHRRSGLRMCVKYAAMRDKPKHLMELRCLRVFAELVTNNVSPHIVLPVCFTVQPDRCILVAECVDCSLFDFISAKYPEDDIRGVLFQVLYTLKCIYRYFPSFKHNDLHAANVLIETLKYPVTYEYHIGTRSYFVTSRHQVRLWDFYFATIDHKDTRSMFRGTHNHRRVTGYYDLHKLFDSLLLLPNLPPELEALATWIVPEEYQVYRRNLDRKQLRMHTVAGVTVEQVLNHGYFEPLYTNSKEVNQVFSVRSGIYPKQIKKN